KDAFGQTLEKDAVFTVKTGEYEPSVELSSFSGIMELDTKPVIPITVINTPKFRVRGFALNETEARRFIDEANASFISGYVFEPEKALKLLDGFPNPKEITLVPPYGAVDGPALMSLDLTELFSPDELKGHLLVVHLPEQNQRAFLMFQMTNLGLTAKLGRTSGLVWTADLPSGRRLSEVEIKILSLDGKELFAGITDEEGLLSLPGGDKLTEISASLGAPADQLSGSNSLFVVAKKDDQMTLWNVGWNLGLDPAESVNVGGLPQWPLGQDPTVGFLLSSQPVYQPGETLQAKFIVRDILGEEMTDIPEKEVKVVIADPMLKIVSETVVPVSRFGTVNISQPIPEDARLGDYSFFLARDPETDTGPDSGYPYIYSNPNLMNMGSVRIDSFRPPSFDIVFQGVPDEMIQGETLTVKAAANHHFGVPVADRPTEYSVAGQDFLGFSLPTLPGFTLVNVMTEMNETQTRSEDFSNPSDILVSGEGTLDHFGETDFSFTMEPAAKPMPRRLTVHLGAQDVDSRYVFKDATLLGHPASLYAGLKSRNMLARAGQEAVFDLAAAEIDGQLAETDVVVTLFQRSYNTVRRKGPGGMYLYSSKASDEKIEEMTVRSQKDGAAEVKLTPPNAGYYWVRASLADEAGRVNESSVSFYVSGSEPVGWRYFNDERLTMIPDKSEYAPGDVAQILIQSPFEEAQALVTAERSGVRRSFLIDVVNQTPVVEIPISADDSPNLFVSVILSRGRIADKPDDDNVDFGKPAIRRGYVNLRVPGRQDLLSVAVSPKKSTYAPGDLAEVDLTVTDFEGNPTGDAEVALVVVNAPLVQLMGDDGYYPDKTFNAERPLNVITANPIVSLLSRRNLALKGDAEAGGGVLRADFARASAQSADSALRADFKNLAYFQPDLELDENGQGQASFKLPDNLTTFKIYAVATGRGRLSGTGEADVLVTKDVLVRSSLPAYASLGDEFQASVVVSNRSQTAGSATVSIKADSLTLLDQNLERTIDLAPGESQEVGFSARAEALGEAVVVFSAVMGEFSDEAQYSFKVLPINHMTAQASFRRLGPEDSASVETASGETTIALSLPEGTDPNRGDLSLELSPSLAPALTGPMDFLQTYPYDCLEQSTSKAMAALIALRLKDRLPLTEAEEAKSRQVVADQIGLLENSSLSGGFTLWPSVKSWDERFPPLSAYALEFLLEARADDFKVPDNLLEDICSYLTSFIGDPGASAESWYSQEALTSISVYSLMALAKAEQPIGSFVETTFAQKDALQTLDLINLVRAIGYLPKSSGRSQMLRDCLLLLNNHVTLSADRAQLPEARPNPWLWSNRDKLTASALLALCETAPHNEFIVPLANELVFRANRGHYLSTQANVTALMALAKYIRLAEPDVQNLTVTASLGEKELASALFKTNIAPIVQKKLPLADVLNEPALTLKTAGTGQAWASVKMNFAAIEPDLAPESANGLTLSRSYAVIRPEESPPGLTEFKRGQVVKVTVTMMTPEIRHDLVLEDRVPAGFETINLSYRSEDQTLLPQVNPEPVDWKDSDNLWYFHQEFWPDKVAVFADYLSPGVYTFSYLIRPVTFGSYQVPGPYAEEMYAPEIYGRGPGQKLTVVPD
ncbi:MAG: hypothetical protein LBJ64_06395, partial [Deltaproteobacteria bacterium]|nr:hypothetical protein [Deltaproteobacteria bacterium]